MAALNGRCELRNLHRFPVGGIQSFDSSNYTRKPRNSDSALPVINGHYIRINGGDLTDGRIYPTGDRIFFPEMVQNTCEQAILREKP
jgi:hypothetical protein